MKRLERLGGAISVFQGLGLFSLTVFFGVLFPRAGVVTPGDFANPAKYLPVVVLHPIWFSMPAFVHGLAADTLFVVTLWALWRRLSRTAPDLAAIAIGLGLLAIIIYLIGHVLDTTYISALIVDFAHGGEDASAASAQFRVASRLYAATLFGGSLFMGLAMMLMGAAFVTTEAFGRALGVAAIATGVVNVAEFFRFVPFALPLSGLFFVWLGIAMWRAGALEADHG
jgi:Domain of unknown function (DUF4386)